MTLTRQEFDRISADILEADKGADEIIIPVVPAQPDIAPSEQAVPADDDRDRKLRLIKIKAKAMKLKLKLAAAALELSL